jgi:2-polyprenyl-3-methyl-5-hydroxy-6-metoxy-1,4-benzoquinol methylase
MRKSHADLFFHPKTGQKLTLEIKAFNGDDVTEGTLTSDGYSCPIIDGIPCFVRSQNYAASFGYQWNQFRSTQLDSAGGWNGVSEERIFAATKWPRELKGERILEAGSGMGRFTEILARTGADIVTFDYSSAVEANRKNLGNPANVCFAQADIFEPPFQQSSFDKVFCLGVLQHCPDPAAAFGSLVRFLKPGGQIVVDVYALNWKVLFQGKYYVRPVTKRISPQKLHAIVEKYVDTVFPVTGLIHRVWPMAARKVSGVLGMADYRGVYPMKSEGAAKELSVLDTFDMWSPAHDHPQTLKQVRRWLESAGLSNIEVGPGQNGIVARGVKPSSN